MINLKGKTAVLYRRVSTTDQKVFGNSLNDQKHRLREYCDKRGVVVMREFEEDCSAKDFNRPEFSKLMEFIIANRGKVNYLLVTKWDRFARNSRESLNEIEALKALGVEVNCIDNWINHDNPPDHLMLLINVGISEIENRIKSVRVKAGNRSALKDGRYVHTKPKGYMSGKNEFGQTLMKPDPKVAPLVTLLFEDYATGMYTQTELRRMDKFKPLKLTKSSLSRMLTNKIYTGRITIKAYENEPEEVIEGEHIPLITWELFQKAQRVGRKRHNQKRVKENKFFPLRGYLECPQCAATLTGSSSTSKTGAKHPYYHCAHKKGCKERFKVKEAHEAFSDLLAEIQPSEEMCELFELVLEGSIKASKESEVNKLKTIADSKRKLEERKELLTEKLLDGVVDNATYKKAEATISDQLRELELESFNLQAYKKDVSEFISFGVYLLKNLNELFNVSSVSLKQKLLGSILDEKLVFKDGKYRTPKFNEGFEYIFNGIKGLRGVKKKTGTSLLKTRAGIEPALPKELDFESSASTSSATWAFLFGNVRQKYSILRN